MRKLTSDAVARLVDYISADLARYYVRAFDLATVSLSIALHEERANRYRSFVR